MISLNWQRGLFRIWVGITALWLLFVIAISYNNFESFKAAQENVSKWDGPIAEATERLKDGEERMSEFIAEAEKRRATAIAISQSRKSQVRKMPWVAIVPPLLLGGLFYALFWVISGFRPKQ